ncbi:MAG: tetratricopeptide repeat protein, partial [Proteobacteria bacterium]|nr:tetratricopeptide repeat protein [Pseudomonadota bacterium]
MGLEVILAFSFGLVFIATMLVLAIKFPRPTPFQYTVFRVVLALAAGGIGAVLPGFLNLDLTLPQGTLEAGGALALFALIYLVNPVQLIAEKSTIINLTQNIGFTPEQYETGVKIRIKEVKKELAKKHGEERDILLKKEQVLVEKLFNQEESYRERLKELAEREKAVSELSGLVPEKDLEKALAELKNGHEKLAEKLFYQVKEQSEVSVKQAAEAEFQLGKIANGRIDYGRAFQHFKRATELQPKNSLYLNEAGILANTLAKYKIAIDYYEKALKSDLKTYGPDHPTVATRWNNLGLAWNSLGDYQKAIDYYEKALKSDLK